MYGSWVRIPAGSQKHYKKRLLIYIEAVFTLATRERPKHPRYGKISVLKQGNGPLLDTDMSYYQQKISVKIRMRSRANAKNGTVFVQLIIDGEPKRYPL